MSDPQKDCGKSSITVCELPEEALLRRYSLGGSYTDCYAIEIPKNVPLSAYVEAFYTTWLFKIERRLLSCLVKRPSTDEEAAALAFGKGDDFSAWRVEARDSDQLLLCDYQGRTRSWLMVSAPATGSGSRLYFGSAVVAKVDAKSGKVRMGFLFHALLGFHTSYSRALLHAAATRLLRLD